MPKPRYAQISLKAAPSSLLFACYVHRAFQLIFNDIKTQIEENNEALAGEVASFIIKRLTWINQLSAKKMCKLLIWLLICMA